MQALPINPQHSGHLLSQSSPASAAKSPPEPNKLLQNLHVHSMNTTPHIHDSANVETIKKGATVCSEQQYTQC
jgi:hypothetical protein